MSNFKEGDILVITRKDDDVFSSIAEGAFRLCKVARVLDDGDAVLVDSIKMSRLSDFADRDIYGIELIKLAYEHNIHFTSLTIEDLKLCRNRAVNAPDVAGVPMRLDTYDILIKSYEKNLIRLNSQLRRINMDFEILNNMKVKFTDSKCC